MMMSGLGLFPQAIMNVERHSLQHYKWSYTISFALHTSLRWVHLLKTAHVGPYANVFIIWTAHNYLTGTNIWRNIILEHKTYKLLDWTFLLEYSLAVDLYMYISNRWHKFYWSNCVAMHFLKNWGTMPKSFPQFLHVLLWWNNKSDLIRLFFI